MEWYIIAIPAISGVLVAILGIFICIHCCRRRKRRHPQNRSSERGEDNTVSDLAMSHGANKTHTIPSPGTGHCSNPACYSNVVYSPTRPFLSSPALQHNRYINTESIYDNIMNRVTPARVGDHQPLRPALSSLPSVSYTRNVTNRHLKAPPGLNHGTQTLGRFQSYPRKQHSALAQKLYPATGNPEAKILPPVFAPQASTRRLLQEQREYIDDYLRPLQCRGQRHRLPAPPSVLPGVLSTVSTASEDYLDIMGSQKENEPSGPHMQEAKVELRIPNEMALFKFKKENELSHPDMQDNMNQTSTEETNIELRIPSEKALVKFVKENRVMRPMTMALMEIDKKIKLKLKLVIEEDDMPK
ncbi:hypothetical protein SK128_026126 [Halocaridina rubra]|uniref:Uncharacterized protein n=1 Tax=Halocaridina rubra TaxID=373956 RepID=A0AAN9A155_HALRR